MEERALSLLIQKEEEEAYDRDRKGVHYNPAVRSVQNCKTSLDAVDVRRGGERAVNFIIEEGEDRKQSGKGI